MPFSAAPTGCWLRSSGGSPPGFPTPKRLRSADRARAVHTGNPVRAAILALGAVPYAPPGPDAADRTVDPWRQPRALIFSPRCSARRPGDIAATIARNGCESASKPALKITSAVVEAYARAGITAEIESFFSDVPQRLARAHLAICRAGASTIAELAAIGRPAVLIPYPYATDDHQTANARAIAAAGGGTADCAIGIARRRRLPPISKNCSPMARALSLMAQSRRGIRPARCGPRNLASLALALEPGAALQECAA